MSSPSLRNVMMSGESDEPVGIDPGKLRESNARDYAIRFVFGAVISVVAGLVALRFGPRAGGLFLAFPAILPASLTLIEQHDGNPEARADAVGAILGSLGLLAFAAVAFLTLARVHPALSLLLALATWTVVSVLLFFVTRGHPKS